MSTGTVLQLSVWWISQCEVGSEGVSEWKNSGTVGFLFMSDGEKDCEIDCRLGTLVIVLQALYQAESSKDRAVKSTALHPEGFDLW